MVKQQGDGNVGTIVITSIISVLITVIVGAVIISQYGRETVATEVSPFIDTARDLVTTATPTTEPATEADIIMEGVAKNQGSSVLIYAANTAEAEFLGRGILVTSNGYIITDSTLVNTNSTYSIAIPGTKDRLAATVVRVDDGLAVLKVTISTSLVAAFGKTLPNINDVVVAITGDAKMRIGTGIVTAKSETTLTTNIFGTITPGTVLVSKSGDAIGISTASNQKAGEPVFKILTKADIDRLTTDESR